MSAKRLGCVIKVERGEGAAVKTRAALPILMVLVQNDDSEPGMTYEEFVESQLRAGVSVEQIRAGINKATLPLSGRCGFCGEPATLLCDYIIGWTNVSVEKGTPRLSSDSLHHTCDTPLCDKCSVNLGITFYSGAEEHGADTTDYCPDHPSPREVNTTAMTEEQADVSRVRRRMYLYNRLKTCKLRHMPERRARSASESS